MNNIYITHQYFKDFPRREVRKPRERYIKLYQDLHALFGMDLSEESFSEGYQYTYSELGEGILDEMAKDNLLEKLDLMVIATWSHEFDPEYTSCGTYFGEKYKITGKIMDVSDQGTIAPLGAIHLISRYLENKSFYKALLLVLEQSTIPQKKVLDKRIQPKMNAALAMIFEKSNKEIINCPRLIGCELRADSEMKRIPANLEIKSSCPSCIEPLLFLNKPLNNLVGRLIVSDIESKEMGCLVWESRA